MFSRGSLQRPTAVAGAQFTTLQPFVYVACKTAAEYKELSTLFHAWGGGAAAMVDFLGEGGGAGLNWKKHSADAAVCAVIAIDAM